VSLIFFRLTSSADIDSVFVYGRKPGVKQQEMPVPEPTPQPPHQEDEGIATEQ
jgi:hypothetical protein